LQVLQKIPKAALSRLDGSVDVRRSAQTLRATRVCDRNTRLGTSGSLFLRILQQSPDLAIAAFFHGSRWFNGFAQKDGGSMTQPPEVWAW
jgi:hypothetical protein